MGKQRQQVISHFFAPGSKPPALPSPPPPPPRTRTTASASLSPAKRVLSKAPTPHTKRPRPSPISLDNPSPDPRYTPLEQQVLDLKARHRDVVLMVEVGYRYRFFGEDADVAERVLGIVSHMDHNFLTASVPSFRLNFHVRRLVRAGYKVGVVRQTETAAIKAHGGNKLGPFTRDLSALYTRATIEAAEDLGGGGEVVVGSSESNYLLCVVEAGTPEGKAGDVRIGAVAVEVSTGDVVYGEYDDNAMRSALEALVSDVSPVEILMGDSISDPTKKFLLAYAGHKDIRVEQASPYCFAHGDALSEVISLYENLDRGSCNLKILGQNMESMVNEESHDKVIEEILMMPKLAILALAVSMRYLRKFGFNRILASFRPFCSNAEITLSADTLSNLEIVRNKSDGSVEGSLFQKMNHTHTSFGSRLLRHWVTHPLRDRESIYSRLDAVSEILDSIRYSGSFIEPLQIDGESTEAVPLEISCILFSVLRILSKTPDVQRGLSKIFHGTATPSEFVGAIHAILLAAKQLQLLHCDKDAYGCSLQTVKSALLRRLILTASSSSLISCAASLLSCLNKDAAEKGDMLHLFNLSDSQFPEVAEGLQNIQMVEKNLNSLIPIFRKQLRVHVEFTTVSGVTHLIELPSDVNVPLDWMVVNSTKKTTRYHPPEVLRALDELSLAKEELAVTCRETWARFLLGFGKYYDHFRAAIQAISSLDCLHSLAILSRNQKHICPEFVEDADPCQIIIEAGRHPVGSFVPASSVKLHVMDGIFTRMGVSDSIQEGRSTFFGEMSGASHILQHSSSHSLVIIDELGQGTSTHDGVAIAYATLHYLLEQKKCMVLFVTHYPEIMEIQHEFHGSVGAYHVSYITPLKCLQSSESSHSIDAQMVNEDSITFLYKVVPGIADRSFGLNVARLAQLPSSCIMRAAFMAAKMEREVRSQNGRHKEEITLTDQNIKLNHLVQPEFVSQYVEGSNGLIASLQRVLVLSQSAHYQICHAKIIHILMDARHVARYSLEKELPLSYDGL